MKSFASLLTSLSLATMALCAVRLTFHEAPPPSAPVADYISYGPSTDTECQENVDLRESLTSAVELLQEYESNEDASTEEACAAYKSTRAKMDALLSK